jgi:hypothetical protein
VDSVICGHSLAFRRVSTIHTPARAQDKRKPLVVGVNVDLEAQPGVAVHQSEGVLHRFGKRADHEPAGGFRHIERLAEVERQGGVTAGSLARVHEGHVLGEREALLRVREVRGVDASPSDRRL